MPRNHPETAATPQRSVHTPTGRPATTRSVDFPVIGIGASAGGLDAFQRFLDAMPSDSGMAIILIQHLDPRHQSLMVELLAKHTAMEVQHAADGMPLQPNRVYVIPPGVYLSVRDGALRLSEPGARHGARLPFDFLLSSLAEELGESAVCVILSGSGADGSLGLKAVKEEGGLVIAQDPDEAGYDGMPRSAITTGAVDLVLPVAEIPAALVRYDRRMALMGTPDGSDAGHAAQSWFPEIIDLLRTKTGYDFTRYKQGTLLRRIERRMAMAAIETDEMERYVDDLRSNAPALDLLAKDMLINVTRFFRDREVFDLLAETVIPGLVRGHTRDRPLRIWIAGCSTGEETYSLAMLFLEQIKAEKSNIGLQVFASDADPDAVASAREGLYPQTIEAEVSPVRLARFFTKEEHGYRVVPELRKAVVFTVHDVLADPPFARLDLVSCRNLLIYLQPEAQAKVVSLFHFALREGGVLLLGSSETTGRVDGRFEAISMSGRIYRHIGHSQPGELGFSTSGGDGARIPARRGQGHAHSKQAALADLCRRLLTETYVPAAVLINRAHECLYSLGPTDRYLSVVPGHPSHDVFAMARDGVRTKLRSAVQRAVQEKARVEVAGSGTGQDGKPLAFSIVVQPVTSEGEELQLVCFLDEPQRERKRSRPATAREVSRVAALEQELEAAKTELSDAIRNLEDLTQAQKEINEEALSVNEEYQATNEELETSKEELQSLNEELTALNSQLHQTLERERTTANDLQNVLYSTDVATLFLDTSLNIRFFTPATKSLFSVIPGDVGRPVADLRSLSADATLLEDAQTVLETLAPIEREIATGSGACYIRRILPYRTRDNGIEGVVITFNDITERRHAADALDAARRQAELANAAKSRFLAAASHDLRQPLQTLALLQGLLEKTVEGEPAQKLVARMADAVGAMSGMLNALLDINQIEAGTVRAEMASFQVDELLGRMKDEFVYHAEARGLALRVVPCGLSIQSDPDLLEQIIRNMLSNALKYTPRGKVLLGCRRRDGLLSIEVWDTGNGIGEGELSAIFEEYYQIGNAERDSNRGVGLGLSIVQRLAKILDHRVSVRSKSGKGSVFAIEVRLAPAGTVPPPERPATGTGEPARRTGNILIVEDDPEVRELLVLFLKAEGHRPVAAADGPAALELLGYGGLRSDLLLMDYNLPNGMSGLQVVAEIREKLHPRIPAIVLSGDISTSALHAIALQKCVHLSKPVKLKELAQVIQRLLTSAPSAVRPPAPPATDGASGPGSPVIFIVDDDSHVREAIRSQLEEEGRPVEAYSTGEAFLEAYHPGREACLLIDAFLPGMSGLELLERLGDADHRLTSILITGRGDVPMAVQAMKAGASDFIEKPIGSSELLVCVERALERSRDASKLSAWREDAANRIATLTPRQRQIMELVLSGHPSKNIAADLGVSQRTVENHRAAIMKRTGSKSLPALARLALAAA